MMPNKIVKKEAWIKGQDIEIKQSDQIDSELSVLTGFILRLKDLVPEETLDYLINAEIKLRLLIEELRERDE